MTTRLCPSTGLLCLSRPCVNRLRGSRCLLDDEREHTLEEIAAELRLDERTVRRDEESVFAKFRAGVDAPDSQFLSTAFIAALQIPRRFWRCPVQDVSHAPHANIVSPVVEAPRRAPVRRAGQLSTPTRFARRNPDDQ